MLPPSGGPSQYSLKLSAPEKYIGRRTKIRLEVHSCKIVFATQTQSRRLPQRRHEIGANSWIQLHDMEYDTFCLGRSRELRILSYSPRTVLAIFATQFLKKIVVMVEYLKISAGGRLQNSQYEQEQAHSHDKHPGEDGVRRDLVLGIVPQRRGNQLLAADVHHHS